MRKLNTIIVSLILMSIIALCVTITFLQSGVHRSSPENVGNEGALTSNFSVDSEPDLDFQDMELTVQTRKMINDAMSGFNWTIHISETDHHGVIVLNYQGEFNCSETCEPILSVISKSGSGSTTTQELNTCESSIDDQEFVFPSLNCSSFVVSYHPNENCVYTNGSLSLFVYREKNTLYSTTTSTPSSTTTQSTTTHSTTITKSTTIQSTLEKSTMYSTSTPPSTTIQPTLPDAIFHVSSVFKLAKNLANKEF